MKKAEVYICWNVVSIVIKMRSVVQIFFPKGICPKVIVIARLEFELTYNDSVVYGFNHYTKNNTLLEYSK